MDLDLANAQLATAETLAKTVTFNFSNLALNFQEVNNKKTGNSEEVTGLITSDPVYEQFLADVWVGIVLTLMVLSCVCFMCSCLIYHKFQEWKRRADLHQNNNGINLESGRSETELPSYTIASGLPTYEEALEQLKIVKEIQENKESSTNSSGTSSSREVINSRLNNNNESSRHSLLNLFTMYKGESSKR